MTSAPKRWGLALAAAAVLAGALLCLPDLLMPGYRRFYQRHFPDTAAAWTLNGRFTSISPLDDPDANVYADRARAFAQDPAADAYLSGRRSRRLLLLDPLSLAVVAGCERALGDMSRAWIAAKFIAGVLWLLGVYALLLAACGNRRYSLAWALGITLFADVSFDLVFALMQGGLRALPLGARNLLIHSFGVLMGRYQYNFGVSRLLNPGLTFPPLFLAAWLALRVEKGRWGRALLAGLAGGALVYVHPDVWTIFVAAMGLYAVTLSWERRRPQLELFAVLGAAAAAALPWFLLNSPPRPDLLVREGGVFSRAVDPQGLGYLLVFAWAAWTQRRRPALLLAGCLVGAVGLIFQAQVVTGFNVVVGRWHYAGAIFCAILVLGLAGRRAKDGASWLWTAALLALLALGREASYSNVRFPFQALPADLEASLNWLDANAPPGSSVAVIAPQEAMMIPIYTREKLLAPGGFMLASDVTTQEILARLHAALALYGVSPAAVARRLRERQGQSQGLPAWNRALWEGRVDWQDREWDNFIYFYAQVMPPDAFADALAASQDQAPSPAQADYVLVTPFERALLPAGAGRRLGPALYRNATMAVYRPRPFAAAQNLIR